MNTFNRKWPAEKRFWFRVNKTEDCWLWTGRLTADRYARFKDGRTVLAHRWSWERVNGPVPQGLELDHLCRVRHCVNPAHLEAVTRIVNVRRGFSPGQRERRRRAVTGTCVKGHRLEANRVQCRECKSDYDRRYRDLGPMFRHNKKKKPEARS